MNYYDLFMNQSDKKSSISLEARNVVKDKFLRLNDNSIYIADKSVSESTLVYSLMNTNEESLELFKKLRLKKSNLLVFNLRTYYMPRILKEKLPNKTIIKNYNNEFMKITKMKKDYEVTTVVNSEDRIKDASSMYDLSYLTNAIKEYTIDSGIRMNRKIRDAVLEIYKTYLSKNFPINNKLVYVKYPFLSNTSIKLNIVESNMLNIFNPFLLFMEWFVNDSEGFKSWLKQTKISFVLEGKDGKLLVLTGRENFSENQMFKPVYVLRLLHMLDGKQDKELLDMIPTSELNEDVAEALTDPVVNDSDVLNDNPPVEIEDSTMDEIVSTISSKPVEKIGTINSSKVSDAKAEKVFEELDKPKNDIETGVSKIISKINPNPIMAVASPELQSKANVIRNEQIEQLSDDVTDIEITAAETTVRGRNKDYFSIIESDLPDEDKSVELVEVHNYTNLKESVETPEIKKLRKNIIKKYGKPVDEVVADIKTHKLEITEFKNVSDADSSYKSSTLYSYNKTYKDKIGQKEFENILSSPMNLTYPILLESYSEKDISSREQHAKEVTINYQTHNGTPLEIKLDIPLTDDHGRLFLGGSYKHLMLQNGAKPVTKAGETVIITTEYSKTILSLNGKYANMRVKAAVLTLRTFDKDKKVMKAKTTDELGDFIYNNLVSYNLIHINRQFNGVINEFMNLDFRGMGKEPNGLTLLGYYKDKEVTHNPIKDVVYYAGKEYETLEFIMSCIRSIDPETFDNSIVRSVTTSGINTPTAKIMNKNIPVIMLLLVAMPLKDLLDKLKEENGLEYKVIKNGTQSVDKLKNNDKFGVIRLSDYSIVLKYNNTLNEVLLTYLTTIDLSKYNVFDITNIMEDIAGNANTALYIENFIEFFIGPETKRVCQMYGIPDDFVGILIYACSLFTSHITFKKNDVRNYRLIAQDEVINRVVYDVISKELSANAARMKRGSRARINIPKDAVIRRLQELPNMSEANQLSPFREIMNQHQVSYKGHNGINEPRAYTLDVRAFNKNNVGCETTATPYSGTAGVIKYLPVNPVIADATGQYEHHDTHDDVTPAQYSSFVESYIPYLSADHINRTIMVSGQVNHIKPVEGADPMLISCHGDENAVYTTPSFSYIAKDKGKVTALNDNFCKIKYEDGTIDVIPLDTINRNSDKGYYLKNTFVVDDKIKLGSTIKKGDVVAYAKNFYKKKPNGQIGLCAGALTWVLFCDSQYVWEDSGLVFSDLAEKLASRVVKRIAHVIDLNTEIRDWNVNIGSEVKPDDVLYKYKVLTDDETINELFSNAESLSLREVDAHYRGKLVDIRVYWRKSNNVEMSASVRKFVKAVDDVYRVQCHMGDLDDVTDQFTKSIVDKRPQLLTKDKFSKINGDNIENGQMLIEYSIEILDKIGPGDKLVVDRALKQEPSVVYDKNVRPVGTRTGRRPSMLSSEIGVFKRGTAGMCLAGTLISIILHEANYANLVLGGEVPEGSLLDYYSSEELIKEYKK